MTRQILFVLMLLLSMVAKAQSADALYEEGKDLYDAKKYEQAFKKLLPAAQKGHKKAQYRVGRCYDKGHGVTEDNQKAYQWYLKASDQGNTDAMNSIGALYEYGHGVEQNYIKASEWYIKAADLGNAAAMTSVGRLYERGHGITQSYTRAMDWYLKASEQGDANAERPRRGDHTGTPGSQLPGHHLSAVSSAAGRVGGRAPRQQKVRLNAQGDFPCLRG